jgi:hypothetical protein
MVAINRRFSAVGCTFSSSPPSINLLLLLAPMGATFNNNNFCPSKFGPFLALFLGFSLTFLGGIQWVSYNLFIKINLIMINSRLLIIPYLINYQFPPPSSAQCPRKLSATSTGGKAIELEERTVQNVMNDDANANANDGQQPGLRPPKHFIQTTFVHRDITGAILKYISVWTFSNSFLSRC